MTNILYVLFSHSLISLCVFVRGAEKMPEFWIPDSDIKRLVNVFREQDVNKAIHGQIQLEYQGHTTTQDSSDNAKRRLFKWVDPILLEKNTYKKWIALSNEYQPQSGIREQSTPKKTKAVNDYLDAVLDTKIWKSLYQFLARKGHPFAKTPKTFRAWIKQLWFVEYSRGRGLIDTSGFEHIFMGEFKNGEISGMHSWLRFYLLERNTSQHFDYRGFTVKRFNFMAAVKFSWRNGIKRSGSFFIGTSPEFDMALSTLCFLTRRSRNTCRFDLEQCPFTITSYDLIQQGKVFIGTIYPTAGPVTDNCRQYNS